MPPNDADYQALWRYLSARIPQSHAQTHIERIAVKRDGKWKSATELHLRNISQDYSVAATITPVDSKTSIGRQIISLNSDEIQNYNYRMERHSGHGTVKPQSLHFKAGTYQSLVAACPHP